LKRTSTRAISKNGKRRGEKQKAAMQ